MVRTSTGPAAQTINERGFASRVETAALKACSNDGKLWVFRSMPCSGRASFVRTKENRAFVPPVSQRRTGKGNSTPQNFLSQQANGHNSGRQKQIPHLASSTQLT